MSTSDVFSPLRWDRDHLALLDQTRLPEEETWLACRTVEDVAGAIRRLSVRGAPAIGVAAAYGLVVGLLEHPGRPVREVFDDTARTLGATRPTAVNLRWALDRGREVFDELMTDADANAPAPEPVVEGLLAWARRVHAEDVETNRRIGAHGAALFSRGDRVLTHCNAGGLATAGYGTAVGVITSSFLDDRLGMVWVDETRPLLQGARLTAWELKRLGIPHKLVTDSSAGTLMARGLVDRIVVGADRIAANGDVANKIGTYPLAVLAHHHGVPFYVAAPRSTLDPQTPTGADIPIEERDGDEVHEVFGTRVSPADTEAANFAFDVTPAALVTAIITEVGVLEAPYGPAIARALDAPVP